MPDAVAPRFQIGDRVKVREAYPIGHVRTPYYVRGKRGVIERVCGAFPNPEELAYAREGRPAQPLYRVRFVQRGLMRVDDEAERSGRPPTGRSLPERLGSH